MKLQIIKKLLSKKLGNNYILHMTDFAGGYSIFVMNKLGKALSRTYWFNDDETTIYFDNLSVDEDERKKGIASELLDSHIETSNDLNTISILWCEKGSWMMEWYKRKGYREYKDHEEEENSIWMKKVSRGYMNNLLLG